MIFSGIQLTKIFNWKTYKFKAIKKTFHSMFFQNMLSSFKTKIAIFEMKKVCGNRFSLFCGFVWVDRKSKWKISKNSKRHRYIKKCQSGFGRFRKSFIMLTFTPYSSSRTWDKNLGNHLGNTALEVSRPVFGYRKLRFVKLYYENIYGDPINKISRFFKKSKRLSLLEFSIL